jgi:hypothetical protein
MSAVVVVVLLGLAHLASGQALGFGFVQGKVVDEKGAPVADVTFMAFLPRMGERLTGTSNDKGEWRINGMAQGEWDITFEKRGYANARAKIVLENQLVRIPAVTIKLKAEPSPIV